MIRIVTDSSCDIPVELAEKHDIAVVPLTIRFGDEEFVDRTQLGPDEFWVRLAGSPHLPETAAPSAGSFEETFTRLRSEGAEGAVAICLSSEVSGTYQSAAIAAERIEGFPVKVIDSRAVSMALGLQVLDAARRAEAGATLADLTTSAAIAASRSNLLAVLDTLEFLKRGGRIGAAQALLGGLLNVKPLITWSDGVVAPAGRVRTRSQAIAALVERVREVAPRLDSLAVIHGAALDLERVLDAIGAVVPLDQVVVAQLGPVVGTHSGPGVIGVAYLLN